MPMSVNMLGERLTNDCHIRTKNGQPHQSTTGVASTSSTSGSAPAGKPGVQCSGEEHPRHGEEDQRRREQRTDPEPPRHVVKFRI